MAEQLFARVRELGVSLVGLGGLLGGLMKTVLETALEAGGAGRPGDERDQGMESEKGCNGTWCRTVCTEVGAVQVEVPRDRDGLFRPEIVRERQRWLEGIDEIVLLLSACGLMRRCSDSRH